MRKTIAGIAIVFATFSMGCGMETEGPQEAVITQVQETGKYIFVDTETIIRFNDGSLWSRGGTWGEPGDTITACKTYERFLNSRNARYWTTC